MVFQLSVIRRLIVCRRGVSGFLVTGPHFEKSIFSAAGAADGADFWETDFAGAASFSKR
jgi:hypothetical protein